MDYRTWILGLVLVLILTNPAGAKVQPSFDCAQVKTEAEKLICSDDELAKLDVRLREAYSVFEKTLDKKEYREKLKFLHERWLDNRNKVSCLNGDKTKKIACLKYVYETRIKRLNDWRDRKDWFFWCRDEKAGTIRFLSRNGEEYLIELAMGRHSSDLPNIVYPSFPEEEIITYNDGDFCNYADIWKQDENKIEIYNTACLDNHDSLTKEATKKVYGDYWSQRDLGLFRVPVRGMIDNFTDETNLNDFKQQDLSRFTLTSQYYTEKLPEYTEICKKLAKRIQSDEYRLVSPLVVYSEEELFAKYKLDCPIADFQRVDNGGRLGFPYLIFEQPNKRMFIFGNFILDVENEKLLGSLFLHTSLYKTNCHKYHRISTPLSQNMQILDIDGKYYVFFVVEGESNLSYSIIFVDDSRLEDGEEKLVNVGCKFERLK